MVCLLLLLLGERVHDQEDGRENEKEQGLSSSCCGGHGCLLAARRRRDVLQQLMMMVLVRGGVAENEGSPSVWERGKERNQYGVKERRKVVLVPPEALGSGAVSQEGSEQKQPAHVPG